MLGYISIISEYSLRYILFDLLDFCTGVNIVVYMANR